MTFKQLFVRAHVWLGLTLGAFWALQGLTGAALVFNRDIQPLLLEPASSAASLLPLDDIFAKASRAAGTKVTMLETFTPKQHLLLAYYQDADDETKQLVIDGRTGAVLDKRNPEAMLPSGGSTWYWLLRFHESLLGGDTGLKVVGVSGLLLLSSLGLGLVIAWPRRAQWKQVYALKTWRNTALRLFGWHRMIGITLGALLLLSASCGAYLAFAPSLRPVLASAGVYVMPFKPTPVDELSPPAITAQQALTIARSRFPDSRLVRAVVPSLKAPVYSFRLLQNGEWRRWAGTTTIFIAPSSGQILRIYDPLSAPLFNKLNDNIYPTHTGEAGGVGLRIAVMLAGLALPTLYLTGLFAWIRKRRRRAHRERSTRDAIQAI